MTKKNIFALAILAITAADVFAMKLDVAHGRLLSVSVKDFRSVDTNGDVAKGVNVAKPVRNSVVVTMLQQERQGYAPRLVKPAALRRLHRPTPIIHQPRAR